MRMLKMMTKDEALEMAIEFMGTLTIDVGIKTWNEKHRKEAIQACKEALEQEPLNLNCKSVQKRLAMQWGYIEQPAQEPVYVVGKGWNCDEMPAEGTKLYTNPAPQPAQEPVGYYYPDERSAYLLFQKGLEIPKDALPLYESFAPSWQGLSDDEIKLLCNVVIEIQSNDVIEYEWNEIEKIALSIESKLKEKNEK